MSRYVQAYTSQEDPLAPILCSDAQMIVMSYLDPFEVCMLCRHWPRYKKHELLRICTAAQPHAWFRYALMPVYTHVYGFFDMHIRNNRYVIRENDFYRFLSTDVTIAEIDGKWFEKNYFDTERYARWLRSLKLKKLTVKNWMKPLQVECKEAFVYDSFVPTATHVELHDTHGSIPDEVKSAKVYLHFIPSNADLGNYVHPHKMKHVEMVDSFDPDLRFVNATLESITFQAKMALFIPTTLSKIFEICPSCKVTLIAEFYSANDQARPTQGNLHTNIPMHQYWPGYCYTQLDEPCQLLGSDEPILLPLGNRFWFSRDAGVALPSVDLPIYGPILGPTWR